MCHVSLVRRTSLYNYSLYLSLSGGCVVHVSGVSVMLPAVSRACFGRASVMFHWRLGHVKVASRFMLGWRLSHVLAMFWRSFGGVSFLLWRCLPHVLVVSWPCLGGASVMIHWSRSGVSVVALAGFWWCLGHVFANVSILLVF